MSLQSRRVDTTTAVAMARRRRGASNRWEFWGRMLVLPYLLVFLVFVLYPVGYGLWLARDPAELRASCSTTRSSSAPRSTRSSSWWSRST